MIPPDTLKRLVEKFDENREQFTSPSYNEAQLRQEFLDPFFGALGWDIENKAGIAEPNKEVGADGPSRLTLRCMNCTG